MSEDTFAGWLDKLSKAIRKKNYPSDTIYYKSHKMTRQEFDDVIEKDVIKNADRTLILELLGCINMAVSPDGLKNIRAMEGGEGSTVERYVKLMTHRIAGEVSYGTPEYDEYIKDNPWVIK